MSLTRTLTLLVVGTVLLITLITAIWGFQVSNHQLEELFDAELAQSTRIVQGLVQHLSNIRSREELTDILNQTLRLPEEAMSEREDEEILPDGRGHMYEKKIAFEVWSPDQTPLLNTLPSNDNQTLRPGFAWTDVGGFLWRTFTLRDPSTGFWIRTAQREDVREELSGELAMGNTLPMLLALPLLVLAVIIAVQIGFQPLRRLEKPVRFMAPERIHPLDENQAPREVAGLVNAVNGLLRRLDQALERERRFSADAAHELRTPLAALRLNLEKACETAPGEFSGLIQAVDRMVHLVEQLLVLSRVDAGTGFSPHYHNLSANEEQSIADVAPLAMKKAIEPVLEDEAGQAMVFCNSALINTLMRSLLANAIQYSPAQTTILTRLSSHGEGYLIAICDQGPGIPPEERPRALSRFVRLDQRQGGGAGLGLAIAQRIAELHGGELALEDRPDSHTGLCVRIWLPARQNTHINPA